VLWSVSRCWVSYWQGLEPFTNPYQRRGIYEDSRLQAGLLTSAAIGYTFIALAKAVQRSFLTRALMTHPLFGGRYNSKSPRLPASAHTTERALDGATPARCRLIADRWLRNYTPCSKMQAFLIPMCLLGPPSAGSMRVSSQANSRMR